MSYQPKPTGEWTHGMAVVQDGVPIQIPYVAVDMHNASLAEAWKDGFLKDKSDMLEAALASERELGQQECNRLDAFWQNEVAKQLAAEREKTEAYRDLWHGQQTTTSEHLKTILQLRSQLSAAQAFIEQCKNAMTGTGSWSLGDTEHTALDAAIAAARKPLVELLNMVERLADSNITGCGTCSSIRNVVTGSLKLLANEKDGK